MITKIKAPKGFKFKIKAYEDSAVIELYDINRKSIDFDSGKTLKYNYSVGHVSLIKDRLSNDFWRTHSSLDSAYWNKGLGTVLYARAIQWALEHKHRVSSSGRSSEMARRLWKSKSIRKFFTIKQTKSKYFKTDPTYGDRYDRWYAYEK